MSHRTRTSEYYATVGRAANPPSIDEFPARVLAAVAKTGRLTIEYTEDDERTCVTFKSEGQEPEEMVFCTRDLGLLDTCATGIIALEAYEMPSLAVLDELNEWIDAQEWSPSHENLDASGKRRE